MGQKMSPFTVFLGIIAILGVTALTVAGMIGLFEIIALYDNACPENPSNEYTIYFDNSTSKATAMSISRLYYGRFGFSEFEEVNASLTSDGKYWIVKIDDNVVTVDAKTGMSKQSGRIGPKNIWRSSDELKAEYIADIHSETGNFGRPVGNDWGRPVKITMDGKEIWKVPLSLYGYDYGNNEDKMVGYIYVDLTTGKSKEVYNIDNLNGLGYSILNVLVRKDGWVTLTELDNALMNNYRLYPPPFKDALRDFYPVS